MQTSSQPKLLPIPFADAGSKQDIPNDSQVGITAGRASYSDGFPPLTRTPLAAGGVPPFGTDFNGVFNDITAAIRWSQAGAGYPFNAAFNTAVAGYPKGARIPNSTLDGFWLNTADGNSANPENTTSALTGWIPSGVYGATAITGLSGSSVTLTTLQASKDRITLAGTLTANINLIVPAWIKRWEIINNCTGAFSVTVKTPSGTGVAVSAGTNLNVIGDGTNIIALYSPGSLIGPPKVFTSSGTYTPTTGTKSIIVEVLGAGGGGGGAALITSGYASAGSGGGSGSYAKHYLSSLSSSYVVTIGVGGTGGVGNASGNAGGTSSFGSIVICPGGFAGRSLVSSNTLGFTTIDSGTYTAITGGNIVSQNGNSSTFCLRTANTGIGGYGSPSPYGSGGLAATATGNGVSPLANSYGAGGGGALNLSSTSINYTGGQGSNGIVIVWEYA